MPLERGGLASLHFVHRQYLRQNVTFLDDYQKPTFMRIAALVEMGFLPTLGTESFSGKI